MVFHSANSKKFHLANCSVIARIKYINRRKLDTPQMARATGLCMCNICSPLARRFRKESSGIRRFAQDHALTIQLLDNTLQITSQHGEWQIITAGKHNTLFLYHKNQRASKFADLATVPGYHSQAVKSRTILGYLEYIASHDMYWETTRLRQREADRILREQERDDRKLAQQAYREKYASKPDDYKRAELRQNTRQFQRGTKNQHYSANQLFSVLDLKPKNHD